jgi:hypothetical protein
VWGAAPAAAAEGECPAGTPPDPVCEYLANEHQAPPVGSYTSTLPGAIEPQPVNKAIEEEFEAELRERRARGAAAAPAAAGSQISLTPPTEGGWVGWCATVRFGSQSSTRCPIAPTRESIGYEAWEADAQGTRGYGLASAPVSAVAVDEGVVVATIPVQGLEDVLTAVLVEIPAPFPAHWFDEFEPASVVRESGHHGLGQPPTARSLSLPAGYWKAPAPPPPGACAIKAGHLQLRPRWGHVVASVSATPDIAGGGFVSCADTEFSLAGSSLDAAVLLDAAQPGTTPQPLPNATRVPGHGQLYSTPGWAGTILARRIPGAWLLVEGGRGLRQRERVLARLSATIRL